MNPGLIIVFLIGIAIIAIAVAIGQKRGKKLLAEGKIVKRQSSFWERSELFTTTATLEDIVERVKTTDFSDCKASFEYFENDKLILFKSSHAWNATVTYKGTESGKNLFDFRFNAFQTRNGIPYRVDTMNMMETAIEKIILHLDPQTTVETHTMKLKTR